MIYLAIIGFVIILIAFLGSLCDEIYRDMDREEKEMKEFERHFKRKI